MKKINFYIAFNADNLTWDVMEDKNFTTVKRFESKEQAERFLQYINNKNPKR